MSPAFDLDGARLAVLANRFEAIVLNMMNTLVRTARSGVINTGRDFSCCVLTGDDELLSMAESQPIHVMSGPDVMARTMKAFHEPLAAGDAFLHNSPYDGNSHAADHSILVPVIDTTGKHHFTVLVKAHQADCGNALPTTYSAPARDVYEEGALIFPCVRVQEHYEDCMGTSFGCARCESGYRSNGVETTSRWSEPLGSVSSAFSNSLASWVGIFCTPTRGSGSTTANAEWSQPSAPCRRERSRSRAGTIRFLACRTV